MRRILRRPEVEAMTGLRRTRLDELERQGKFPQRIRISDRATGWRSDEIEAWIEARPRACDVDADMGEQLRAIDVESKRKGAKARTAAIKERREARAMG